MGYKTLYTSVLKLRQLLSDELTSAAFQHPVSILSEKKDVFDSQKLYSLHCKVTYDYQRIINPFRSYIGPRPTV
jgi:hypothetical protein